MFDSIFKTRMKVNSLKLDEKLPPFIDDKLLIDAFDNSTRTHSQ